MSIQEEFHGTWRKWSRYALRGKSATAQLKALAKLGLLHLENARASECQAIFDGLAYKGADNSALFMAQAHLWGAWQPLLASGSADVLRLKRKRALLALAVTESESGSDIYALKTEARETKRGWVLSGKKAAITNATLASHALVFARAEQPNTMHCFLVDLGAPGVAVKRSTPFIGLREADIGEIAFRGVTVPHSAMLGAPGAGAEYFRIAMAWERSLILSPAAGATQRLREELADSFGGKRRAGKNLREQELFQRRLERVDACIEAMRGAVREAARALDSGAGPLLPSIRAKVAASAAYEEASRILLQTGGKDAFRENSPWERNYRDSMMSYLYSGPNDILSALLEQVE